MIYIDDMAENLQFVLKSKELAKTYGMCRRFGEESYDKDWTTEKEVRLKVGIQQLEIFANGYKIHDGQILKTVFFPKIAIPVSENAFDVVKIGFSPQFYARKEFLEEIR